jgi:DNA glycosylase AlkZ-like
MLPLSTKTLNRTLLHRQLLLARHRLGIPATLNRIGGLQTQYSPSGYIGLWSRVEGFSRPQLTRALETGRVLQGTMMRVTIHMVSATDYPLLTEGVRESRRQWWLRAAHTRGLDGYDYPALAGILRLALEAGPKPRKELVAILEDQGYPGAVWEGAGLWIDMIRVPPSGTWERRRADLYGLAPTAPTGIDETTGLAHLARRYLAGFGPSTVSEMSGWAGVPVNKMRSAIDTMGLRTLRDDTDRVLLDLPRKTIVDPTVRPPVRLLPVWDATLLVHARHTGVLPEEYRSEIFTTSNPFSLNTVLVDGSVRGIWKLEGDRVLVEPFAPIPRTWKREVEAEAGAMAGFLTG